MDVLQQLNEAMAYLESNLCEEPDWERLSQIACVTKDSFLRFFSYMTGMSLKEYLRRRRLTLAACELRDGDAKVLETAVKYGWKSADAFAKAFARQHGMTPRQARDSSRSLKIYPPASFCLELKGAREMDFRMLELEETAVYGVSRPYNAHEFRIREELRHVLWSEDGDFAPGRICDGYDGVWYGVWQDGSYCLAREKGDAEKGGLEKQVLPAGSYAAFRTECGGLAWEELPRLFELIFDSWLPHSAYRLNGDRIIEVYHLWTDREKRRKHRYYEVWIPVSKTGGEGPES